MNISDELLDALDQFLTDYVARVGAEYGFAISKAYQLRSRLRALKANTEVEKGCGLFDQGHLLEERVALVEKKLDVGLSTEENNKLKRIRALLDILDLPDAEIKDYYSASPPIQQVGAGERQLVLAIGEAIQAAGCEAELAFAAMWPEEKTALIGRAALGAIRTEASPEQDAIGDEWFQHVKGGVYKRLGLARMQMASPLLDMDTVAIYEGQDGCLWVRPLSEFLDRFKPLPAPPTPEKDKP